MATPTQPVIETEERSEGDHPLDGYIPDPSGRPPLCSPAEFKAIVDEMVADAAPRVFAVVQEYGDRVDLRIAAWGIAFDDHAEAVGVHGGLRLKLDEPEDALRAFAWGSHISAHLAWVNPCNLRCRECSAV